MDILYKLKCEVPLRVSWHGCAPTELNEWIKLQIRDKVVAKIGITPNLIAICSYEKKTMKKAIEETNTIYSTDGLIIQIEGYWPEEITELLRDPTLENELLKIFRQDIQDILKQISITLIDNIRNYFGQYWLSVDFPFNQASFIDTLWLDSDGEWKRIYPKMVFLNMTVHMEGLSKKNWSELGKRLENKSSVNMIGTMMSNSAAHLENNNGRMAIVESVCALESAIKQYIPSMLAEMVTPPIPESLLDKAIEEMGLRLTAQIIFAHLSKKFSLDPDNCSKCLDAINIRNNIIHNQQRTISVNEASQYIGAIHQIIKSINNSKNGI